MLNVLDILKNFLLIQLRKPLASCSDSILTILWHRNNHFLKEMVDFYPVFFLLVLMFVFFLLVRGRNILHNSAYF